jgi:hypothetical protein
MYEFNGLTVSKLGGATVITACPLAAELYSAVRHVVN